MEDLEKLNRNLSIYSDLIDKTNRFINNLDKSGGTYFIRDLKDSFPTFSSFPDDGVVDIDTLKSLRKWLEAKRDKIDSEIMRIKVQSIKSKRDEIPLQVSSVDPDSSVEKSVVSNNNQVSGETKVKYLPEEVLDLRGIKSSNDIKKYLSNLGADINKYKKVIISNSGYLERIDFHGLDVDFYCMHSDSNLVFSRSFLNVGRLNILSSNLIHLFVCDCSLKSLNIPQSVKYLSLSGIRNIKNFELSPYLEVFDVYDCNIKGLKIPQSVKELYLRNVNDIENLELPQNLEKLSVEECSLKDLKIPQSVKELCLRNVSDIENLELPSNLEKLSVVGCSLKDLKILQSVKELFLADVSYIGNLELPSNLEKLSVVECSLKDLKIPQSVKELCLAAVSDIENLELLSNLEKLSVEGCSLKDLKIPASVKLLSLTKISDIENLELLLNLEKLYMDNCNIKTLRIPSNLKKIILFDVNDLDLGILESIPLNVEIDYEGDDNNIKKYFEDRELAGKINKKKKGGSFTVKLFQDIIKNHGKNKK